ncbi:MAG: WYL domain-containing protein [Erysipelotrichaceae bacterium]|nr:WYL domain-containing protein [Erysipelotrichaceae bacterium]
MEEKIKVYVSKDIDTMLTKDADFFEFCKKDRSLNRNDFINTLIVNYFDSYAQADNALTGKLEEVLSGRLSDAQDLSLISGEMLNAVKDYQYSSSDRKAEVTISVKPTRKSAGVIDYIQSSCLTDISLSGYFRNMFASYCSLPQDRREEIIFKEKFETVSRAISEGRMIYFTTNKSTERHEAAPYAIARSQEELFNYMICYYNGQPFSFRMTRLQNVRVLNKTAVIPEDTQTLLEKMRSAPQFAYNKTTEICVMLSERGQKLFNRIYSYRPRPTNIIKGLYYFDCSEEQIFQYFFRYGSNARVIYPESLRLQMQKAYANAAEVYAGERKM